MFNRRTLFVLGAGSSAEVDLPVGKKLAESIGSKMDIRFEFGNKSICSGDMALYSQMTGQMRYNVQEFQQAAWLIRDGIGLAQSIDDFLDIHRNNANLNLYGKAAIVKAVLEAEHGSKLYFDRNSGTGAAFDPSRLADTWFVKFMHMLSRGIPRENVREIFEGLSFINFNYDRCVEFFLANALQKLHGISEDEAADILTDLQIIHPYGVVEKVPFGATSANYLELAAGIKTYTEQLGEQDVTQGIKNEIQRAECIVFLGFAYHRQNMQILTPDTEAVGWFLRSIEASRNHPIAHFMLAAALALLGSLDQARAATKAGLALDPSFTIRHFRDGANSDNPTYLAARERIYQGLRMAGVPEG
jgi:hypothetical protein